METKNMAAIQYLPAGNFSAWLRDTRDALISGSGIEVPCGECNACCRSSYFIHIRSEETRTLNRILKVLLFPAAGLPKGNKVLGYDQNGRCPMLINNNCSIYTDRPLTCRSYDCRIFPATGINVDEENRPLIRQQIQRWEFSYPTQSDQDEQLAVQAAATFLQERAEYFPASAIPRNSTQVAIMAIKVYDVFLNCNDKLWNIEQSASVSKVTKAIMEAYEKFERMMH